MFQILGATNRPSHRRSQRAQGFVLLITVTLLAFLVLLLVSLASLTRVETQVAANTQQLSGARQNALFALNLAVGQLQKFAGPDQRITTTADLVATTDKNGVNAPVSISTAGRVTVSPGARPWTAVWGNSQKDIGYDLRPSEISGRSVSPALLTWLISGNESTAFTANGTKGGVNAGTGITYSPASVIDLANLSAPTIDGTPAILLVGPLSTGSAATTDYVAAPLRPLRAAATLIPGADTSASAPPNVNVGRYAWWIGDEGVKARVNLRNGYQQSGAAADRIHSFVTAQRAAVELLDREPPDPASPGTVPVIGSDYSLNNPSLTNLVSPRQLPLLGADSASRTRLSTAASYHFHDLTAVSQGVLSDPYAGGLKKNLTADLTDTSSDPGYRPADNTPIFTPVSVTEPNLPTWGHLRSWARAVNPSSGEITPKPATDTSAGLAPVMIYASIGFEAYVAQVDTDGDGTADANVMRMAIYPVVMLANPYPVPISAHRYDVGLRFMRRSYALLKSTPNLILAATGDPDNATVWTSHALLDFGSLDQPDAFVPLGAATENTVANTLTRSSYLRFTLDCKDPIPPGEIHLYRLDDSAEEIPYAPGKLLTRAPSAAATDGDLGITNYLVLPGTYTLPATVLPDHVLSLHSRNVSANTSGSFQCMDFTLAEEGGLEDPARRFQHHSIIAATRGANHAQNHLVHAMGTTPTLAGAWQSGGFTEAQAAFRFGFPMETFVNWMSPIFGMAQFHNMVWLRHGNFRAPLGLSTLYETYTPYITGNPSHATYSGAIIAGAVATNDSPGGDPALIFPTVGYATSMGGNTTIHPSYGHASTHIMAAPTPAGTLLNRAIFFDVPDAPDRLLSLGQLQHAPFSRYLFDPLNAFGNSLGALRVPRTNNYNPENIIPRDPRVISTSTVNASAVYDPTYDLSWHLNHSLWDRYFLSGVPSDWTQAQLDNRTPLPDARLIPSRDDGTPVQLADLRKLTGSSGNPAYTRAAANLKVAGAFNINSTSEQAWRAILGGPLGLETDDSFASTADKVPEIIPYARFARSLKFPGDSVWAASDTTMRINVTDEAPYRTTNYLGNRGLWLNTQGVNKQGSKIIPNTNTSASAVINELAKRIVIEIRRNGPFLSLSDFVNRPLLATENPAGIKGPLQTAIDTMSPLAAQANPRPQAKISLGTSVGAGNYNGYDANRMPSNTQRYKRWDWEHYFGGPLDIPNSQIQTGTQPTAYAGEAGTDSFRYANAFGPKYLTQADLLSTLGPQLSARSDTFVIRTYGETLNPATGATEGRAWCEAVLQRIPSYIAGEPAETAPADLPANSLSKTFGRSFKIVSFRWLSANEI